jgi:hypothetical protein
VRQFASHQSLSCLVALKSKAFTTCLYWISFDIWFPSYIRVTFAANAGIQSITSQDLVGHPYAGEIEYRANIQSCVIFLPLSCLLMVV